jgi:hypothetical protein
MASRKSWKNACNAARLNLILKRYDDMKMRIKD